MKKIKLTKGKYTIIDNDDYEDIKQFNWCYSGSGYAVRGTEKGGRKKAIFLHQQLLNFPKREIDHINRNKLDNRKQNLRIVSRAINVLNRDLIKTNKSGYTGVSWSKHAKKWIVYFRDKYCGYFKNKKEGSKIYKQNVEEFLQQNLWLKK